MNREVVKIMDKISASVRSRNMSKIRSVNTKPEKYIRLLLFHMGFRYRISYKGLPGRPDIYMSRYNTAIFINGCFWHRHENCRYSTIPKSNTAFWTQKFAKNTERDARVYEALGAENVKVIVIWECTIKKMMKDEEFKNQMLGEITDAVRSEGRERMEF